MFIFVKKNQYRLFSPTFFSHPFQTNFCQQESILIFNWLVLCIVTTNMMVILTICLLDSLYFCHVYIFYIFLSWIPIFQCFSCCSSRSFDHIRAVLLVVVLWFLWKFRNNVRFRGTEGDLDSAFNILAPFIGVMFPM